MKKLNDMEKKMIDSYYGEGISEIDSEFDSRLQNSLAEMDVFDDDFIHVPNNFFNLIEQAEQIKSRKAANKEFVLFMLLSSGIVIITALGILFSGIRLEHVAMILFTISMLLPFSLIPIASSAVKRGDRR